MICPKCQGTKTIIHYYVGLGTFADLPCPECDGSGIAYCCEGHQEAPRPEDGVDGSPQPPKRALGAPCEAGDGS